MEDLPLIAELDTACPPSVGQMLEQLRQEVAELRGEVTQLRRENLELRQQAGYWKGQHAQAVKRIEQLQHDAEHLRGENRQLQSQACDARPKRTPARIAAMSWRAKSRPPRNQRNAASVGIVRL